MPSGHLLLRWEQQVGLALARNALGGREPAEGIQPETRDVMHRPYMPREPCQADFRRRENLDLMPERTESSCDLTGGEPGPFREQNAHAGKSSRDGGRNRCRYKLRCSLISEKPTLRSDRRMSALPSARQETKGGWCQRQRPKCRARSRLWRLTKNFQQTLRLRASNEAQRQLAFDIEVTSQRTVPELTGS